MSGSFDMLEHVPISTYVFRVEGNDFVLEDVNAFARSLNPAIASMRGRNITHLYRDQPQAHEDAQRCVKEKTTVVRETTVRRHDRTEATQLVRLSYVFYEPDHMVIFMQDISTPPMAAAAIRESETRYRSLVESLPDAILLRGPDRRVLACNDNAVRLFGAKSQFDLLGAESVLSPAHRIHTEGGEPVAPEDLPSIRVLSTGVAEIGQVYAFSNEQGTRWVRVAAEPIRAATGAVTGSITTFTDITERIDAQRALRESSERLDLALTTARMGVWEFDPKAGTGFGSKNLESIFRFPSGPSSYATFLQAVHPDDRATVSASGSRSATAVEGEAIESEFRIVGTDNVTRWARVRGRVSRDGERLRVLGTIMDVTEQHHLEEELRRAHRLESIGRLAGGIAHDFNNLLAAMMGSLELLEEQCPPSAHADLVTIRHGATRARDLTKQLLAFARKQPVTYKIIDLSAAVTDIERLLRRLVGPDVDLALSTSGRVHVRADPSLLEQVLVNLIVNAREAMPNGGRVAVHVAQMLSPSPDSATPRNFALLEVSDSGVGMDEETRSRIFDPFFTTKASGTGLGLASSYGIVKQHGGNIIVDTEPGRGTRFRVLLPLLAEDAECHQPGSASPARQGRGCILVVDDEELVRNTALRMLRSLGYEVLAAANGVEAVKLSEKHSGHIDALVCDVAMPGQDGPSVARQLQRLRPGLKVLFASGYSADDHEVLTGKVFLSKPYTRAELAAKLHELLVP